MPVDFLRLNCITGATCIFGCTTPSCDISKIAVAVRCCIFVDIIIQIYIKHLHHPPIEEDTTLLLLLLQMEDGCFQSNRRVQLGWFDESLVIPPIQVSVRDIPLFGDVGCLTSNDATLSLQSLEKAIDHTFVVCYRYR